MKIILIPIGLFVLISLFSCKKEDEPTIEKNLLKSKLWYNTIIDSIPVMRYDFMYNNNNDLDKVNIYIKNSDTISQKVLYSYNIDGKLEYKLHFSFMNSSDGTLIDSTYYDYEADLLKTETLYYLQNSSYVVTYVYEYLDSKLFTKCRIDYNELSSCIKYDYTADLCIQEIIYSDINFISIWNKTVHYYQNGIRTKTEVSGSQGIVFQIITYSYDYLGNLILEVSQETDFSVSRPVSYVYRYEYN
jgi:hypothetical protein